MHPAAYTRGYYGRQGRSPKPTGSSASEDFIPKKSASRLHLSQEDLRQLRFKDTMGSGLMERSEGHEAKFNCSIDLPGQPEPSIMWLKNDVELSADNMQVVVNELQTTNDGVTTLLSTVW